MNKERVRNAFRRAYAELYSNIPLYTSQRVVNIEKVLYHLEMEIFGDASIHDYEWLAYKTAQEKLRDVE